MSETRDLMRASFMAASRMTNADPRVLTLTRSSAAGMMLYLCAGPRAALEVTMHMPQDTFWAQVAEALEVLVDEETRDTEPPMAAAGE